MVKCVLNCVVKFVVKFKNCRIETKIGVLVDYGPHDKKDKIKQKYKKTEQQKDKKTKR